MAVAEWDLALTQATTLAKDITYQIAERDELTRTGKAAGDLAGRVRGNLTHLERMLEKLDTDLKAIEVNAVVNRLAPRDVATRRDGVRKLQTERNRLKTLERASVASASREALLGGAAPGGFERETNATRDLTTAQLMEQARREEKAQDEIAESMSKGLDSLKHMGLAIRDETDLHMKLLDRMEGEVDKADNSLQRETARAKHITEATKTCWLYMTICLLLLLLIILVLAKWH